MKTFDSPIWEEKYRAQTLDDCILRESLVTPFKKIVESGTIGRMVFHGTPGTSKTTTAKALCRTMGLDWEFINGSTDNGVDMIRDRLTTFASTASLSGNGKCFIIDEGCRLSPNAMDAMKGIAEKFANHCSIIITANHPNRLTDAIRSRFTYLDFNPSDDESKGIQVKMFKRLCDILKNEGVTYNEKVLAQYMMKHFPDFREIVRGLQYYSTHGHIDEGILMMVDQVSVDVMIEAIKKRSFKSIVEFAENNANNDLSAMYQELFYRMKEQVTNESKVDLISIINDYQRHDSIVPSKTVHIVGLCTELMSTVDFK